MQAHGMRLHFYTGPPAALAAVSAVLLGREAGGSIGLFSRLAGWLCGIIGALAFAAQVFLFPWKIQYSMWDPTLTQRQFASILFATALAPLLFLLLSKRDRSSFGRSSSLKSGYLFAVAFSAFLICWSVILCIALTCQHLLLYFTVSLALPALLLAWLGPRSQAPFLIAQLLSCQLAALYSVDFYGIDDLDNSNWWNRLVGLLESALCLGQLPLHFILCSLALDSDNGSSMEDGSGDIASVAEIRWPLVSLYGRIFANNNSSSGSGRFYSSVRIRNDDDLTPLFIALITLPLPVCLIVLMASSLQAVCLSVATLLLGSDFLAENYADFLIDMLQASFASLNDGKY
uniref:Pecanex-like protein n=1 Tax=Macrostomum lignano TaxID=282301 RepID=A0A1I8HJ63_9PLAT